MVEVAALAAGWLTPTSLFVLLNIVIATIFFTSSFGFGSKHRDHPEPTTAAPHPQLFRAPSLFSRVTSFNFSTTTTQHHYSYQPEPDETHFQAQPDPSTQPLITRAPSFLARVASFNFCRAHAQPQEEPAEEGNMGIISSQQEGSREENVTNEKKTEELVADDDEEREKEKEKEKKKVVVKRNKVTGKKTKVAAVAATAAKMVSLEKSREEEVDAKADDFINRFKQQLKMQRLESLLRYRSPAS